MSLFRAVPLFLAVLFLCAGARADTPTGQEATRFREAEYVYARNALTPPMGAGVPWRRVALPDSWKENWPGITGTVWYRVDFQANRPEAEPWMVYLPRMREGGALFVNGQLLVTVREPDSGTYVRWMRPHAFLIAPGQLRNGGNELHVRLDVESEDKVMSTITIGPEHAVRPLYESRHLWTYTVAQITIAVTLSLAVFVIAIWLRRRLDFDYGLFGLASLFWGLHTTNYVIETLPEWAWLPWRVIRNLPERLDLAAEDALQILRVLQESLTNVLKHAGARQVSVELARQPDPARLVLTVADDGGGFDAASPAAGRGLSGMRRRARQIGATLDLATGAGGTRVTLQYPLTARPPQPGDTG